MTESNAISTSVGAVNFSGSAFCDATNSTVYVDSNNPNIISLSLNPYGGACSQSLVSLGSWTNSPTYGYSEPSFVTKGFCVFEVKDYSSTGVTDPTNVIEGPIGYFAFRACIRL